MIPLRRSSLLLALLLAACQSPGNDANTPEAGARPASGRIRENASGGELVVNPNDPCVTNLGAVAENLMLYYSVRHKLPDKLSDLPATSVTGQKLSYSCPDTGKPYTYVPRGIYPPYDIMPTASVLILYDEQPAHPIVKHIGVGKDEYDLKQIVRYGIVYQPSPPGQPLSMHVAPIEDNLLKMYLNAPQPAVPPSSPGAR